MFLKSIPLLMLFISVSAVRPALSAEADEATYNYLVRCHRILDSSFGTTNRILSRNVSKTFKNAVDSKDGRDKLRSMIRVAVKKAAENPEDEKLNNRLDELQLQLEEAEYSAYGTIKVCISVMKKRTERLEALAKKKKSVDKAAVSFVEKHAKAAAAFANDFAQLIPKKNADLGKRYKSTVSKYNSLADKLDEFEFEQDQALIDLSAELAKKYDFPVQEGQFLPELSKDAQKEIEQKGFVAGKLSPEELKALETPPEAGDDE